jgi:hypothetical protein
MEGAEDQNPALVAAFAQLLCLHDSSHREHLGAALTRCAGTIRGTMSIAIGFDDRTHRRPASGRAQPSDITFDSAQIHTRSCANAHQWSVSSVIARRATY